MKNNIYKLAAACAMLAFFTTAKADLISYEGTLSDGVSSEGEVLGDYNSPSSDLADYWTFFGNMGDIVTITVNRIDSALDPALWIFAGIFGDDSVFGATLNAGDAGYLGFADDQIPHAGPFGDPTITLALTLPGTGQYTAIVTNFASGASDRYRYNITGQGIVNVPEPGTLALLGIGLLGMGLTRRKKTV